jgi:hypothetical protein
MEKTIAETRARLSKMSVAEANAYLRPARVRIGYDRGGQEWFADFTKDHPQFEAGAQGTRSFTGEQGIEGKAQALDAAVRMAAWAAEYAAKFGDLKAA